jgi:tetratricopeptide (TPR) repeat protein
MTEVPGGGYLSGLPEDQQDELTRVNAPGLAALREYLSSGEAVAFLGAGVSRPLYPLWEGLIGELVDAAAGRLTPKEEATCRALARENPEAVVEVIRRSLGTGVYREVLRGVLRVQTDPDSGRSWTRVQELVCRCAFKAVVTTNYDPGIVDARIRVRPTASATGFMTWEDELGLDRWRSGDVFGEAELPVLFAHGQHNRPDSVVLATTEYRRAYAGKLPHVLGRLMDSGHLVWIGFSFADQRVTAILREIADQAGTRIDPGSAPRHVALMAWDPGALANDPGILAQRAEIEYGADVILYPAPGNDHSALGALLATVADPRFPAVGDLPAGVTPPAAVAATPHPDGTDVPVAWEPTLELIEHFTGRAEELARLDRWAADPQVALIGVTAWGGAGKTALVTHWIQQAGGPARRPGIRGIFGWSFYSDPSAENWGRGLLRWARQNLGFEVTGADRLGAALVALLRRVPLLLVLDGLERVQEGPAGNGYGRLLDGTLREVLSAVCEFGHGGLVILTSRFPFADLETFDGGRARVLEVPPFTPADGAVLLAAAGGDWLAEDERRALVRSVDGHALATGALASVLADRPPAGDLAALRADLAAAARTDARVSKVLEFYAARLTETDRYLLAAVSLFARPVELGAVLAVAGHEAFGSRLAGWTSAMVQDTVRDRLGGLATWHPDGTISAHPLVRDAFRPLVLDAADAAAETSLTGLPAGTVTSRVDALRVVEAIELLLDANHWQPADDLYKNRSGWPPVWLTLPAARLGMRAAIAFVGTAALRSACATNLTPRRLGYYLASVGLYAKNAGDMAIAQMYLSMAINHDRRMADTENLAVDLLNLTQCLGQLGQTTEAREAIREALSSAESAGNQEHTLNAHTYSGWVAALAGDAEEAEKQFLAADHLERAHYDAHLRSMRGTLWAEWLIRSARPGPARALTGSNIEVCRSNGWNDDLARCERVLGRLALAKADTSTAGEHLESAAAAFRDGDYVLELATTLIDMSDCALSAGDLDAAEDHVTEAISIAAPRGLVPDHCAALATRARIRARRSSAAVTDPESLFQGRDAADAALRLAERHHLAWHELGALRAHAALDQAEGVDRGWAAKAAALHGRLVPPGLDPDPLATVERLVAG